EALQLTADARPPRASLPAGLWSSLGLSAGDVVRLTQGAATLVIAAEEDRTLVDGVVRVAAGHADTASLGAMFGAIHVEKA
ncbi:MAG: NADH-quinone oxidoreductase subunit G, partial [Rubrivivax sp.]